MNRDTVALQTLHKTKRAKVHYPLPLALDERSEEALRECSLTSFNGVELIHDRACSVRVRPARLPLSPPSAPRSASKPRRRLVHRLKQGPPTGAPDKLADGVESRKFFLEVPQLQLAEKELQTKLLQVEAKRLDGLLSLCCHLCCGFEDSSNVVSAVHGTRCHRLSPKLCQGRDMSSNRPSEACTS